MIATLLLAAAAYQPPAPPEMPSPERLLVRLGLFTAGVVGLAAAAVWLARRRGAEAEATGDGPRVVATARLAGRCSLHLLRVGDEHFVAATDAGGLKALQALPEPFAPLVEQALDAPAERGAVTP